MVKWLVAVLAIVNLGLFLWATGHDPDNRSSFTTFALIDPDSMLLLSEIQPKSDTTPTQSGGPKSGTCIRIGPFVDPGQVKLAAEKLNSLALTHERRTVKSRAIRAYRVFVGPFENNSSIRAQQNLLNAGGITDHYVKREAQGGDILSLGLFSQRNGADLFVKKLAAKNVVAKLRAEDRQLDPNIWLEIADPAVAAGVPDALDSTDWGEKAAKLHEYTCP